VIVIDEVTNLQRRDRQRGPKARKWLTGCGIGCGVLVLVVVIGLGISTYFMQQPFRAGITTRESLDERFGDQGAFVPDPDGSIPLSRVEAFLAVRQRLMTHCPVFEEIFGRYDKLDELDDDTSGLDAFEEVVRASRSVMQMGSATGEFFQERNTALMDVGMGFGEYTYIYVLAYRDRLDPFGAEEGDGSLDEPKPSLSRIQKVHLALLRNQLQAAEEAAVRSDGIDTSWTVIIDRLRAEIAALERRPGHLPWRSGLLPAASLSLAPYRARLDSLFCERTIEFEFVRNRSSGIGISGD